MTKKTIIRQMLYLVLLLGTSTHIYAQSANFIPSDFQGYCFAPQNLGFATPQTAEFVQYGNTKINYYNGLLDLNIPLFDYKDPAFDLPISIQYISDGFKPGRRPSMVGNNWILNVGGSITRNVVGTPDDIRQDQRTGLLAAIRDNKFKQYSKDDLLNVRVDEVYRTYPFPETVYDMAPDIFEFNFGRHKGRFIIDNTGNAKCISGGGYRIDLSEMAIQDYSTTEAPKRSVINITTPDGYRYSFGGNTSELEYSIPNNPKKLKEKPVQITSWYLRNIKDETGNNSVSFSYESRMQKNKYYLFISSFDGGVQCTYFNPLPNGSTPTSQCSYSENVIKDRFLMEDKIYAPILKTISTGNVKINFTTQTFPVNFFGDSDGNDLIYLSGITMTEYPFTLKSCKFDYQQSGRYFFLKKLILHDQSENPAIYSFDYNLDINLPDPLTTSTDHWGFWNGGYDAIDNVDTYFDDGRLEQRKATNTSVSSRTMLKEITYPTKGKEMIDYEYNRYKYYLSKRFDAFAWNSIKVDNDIPLGGVRVKRLTLHDPDTGKKRQRSFAYLDPTTGLESGRINELPRYEIPIEDLFYISYPGNVSRIEFASKVFSKSSNSVGRLANISEYPIGYSDVTETFDDGGFCRYHFSSLADVPDDANLGVGYVYCAPSIYSRSFNSYQVMDKTLNYGPNPLINFRGKLLSKNTYNNLQQKVASEEYTYNFGDKTKNYEVSIANNSGSFLASKIFTVPCLMTQEKLTDENGVTILHNYEYNDHGFVTQKETVDSNGDHLFLKYFYPDNNTKGLHSDDHYTNLKLSNRIEEPVALIKYIQKAGESERKVIDGIQQLYEPFQDCGIQKRSLLKLYAPEPLPENTDFGTLANMLNYTEAIEAYDNYDYRGNIITYRSNREIVIYLWCNRGSVLAAEIKGATYEEVKKALRTTPEYYSMRNGYSISELKDMRDRLPHAHVTIYDHEQQVGVKYVSTSSGKDSYFQFDPHGRLQKTFRIGESGERQLIEYNDYHFAK